MHSPSLHCHRRLACTRPEDALHRDKVRVPHWHRHPRALLGEPRCGLRPSAHTAGVLPSLRRVADAHRRGRRERSRAVQVRAIRNICWLYVCVPCSSSSNNNNNNNNNYNYNYNNSVSTTPLDAITPFSHCFFFFFFFSFFFNDNKAMSLHPPPTKQ